MSTTHFRTLMQNIVLHALFIIFTHNSTKKVKNLICYYQKKTGPHKHTFCGARWLRILLQERGHFSCPLHSHKGCLRD